MRCLLPEPGRGCASAHGRNPTFLRVGQVKGGALGSVLAGPVALIGSGAGHETGLVARSAATSLVGQVPVQDLLKGGYQVVVDGHGEISFWFGCGGDG